MAHLKKNAGGHLLKNAAGHLVKTCWEVGDDCTHCAETTPAKYTVLFSGVTNCGTEILGEPLLDAALFTLLNGEHELSQVHGSPCFYRKTINVSEWVYGDISFNMYITLRIYAGPQAELKVWIFDIPDPVDELWFCLYTDVFDFSCTEGGDSTNFYVVSDCGVYGEPCKDANGNLGYIEAYDGEASIVPGP